VPDPYQTLVPRPRAARSLPGTFELTADTPLIAAPGAEPAAEAVRLLLAPLRLPLRPASSGTGLTVRLLPGGDDESYQLTVTEDGVELSGSTVDGVRHAVQTLRQLLPAAAFRSVALPGTRWIVPCGEVRDAPELSWRAGMIDVSRHFLPKHELLRYVDLFALHKLNRLHLHLTDDQGWRIESRRYPRLHEVGSHRPATQAWYERNVGVTDGTPHGGYYTLDDLSEIAGYAAERGVTVVPEIDLPGHAAALLAAYPEYGIGKHSVATGWGISTAVVKPVPATIRFLTDVLGELTDALPGPYVHIGGDECMLRDWATDPEVAVYLKELDYDNPVQLFGHFLRQLAGYLAGRGRRTVVWDEGFVGGGVLAGLPRLLRLRPVRPARRADVHRWPDHPGRCRRVRAGARRLDRRGAGPGHRRAVQPVDRIHSERPAPGLHDVPPGLRLRRGRLDRPAGRGHRGAARDASGPAGRRRCRVPAAFRAAALAGGRHRRPAPRARQPHRPGARAPGEPVGAGRRTAKPSFDVTTIPGGKRE